MWAADVQKYLNTLCGNEALRSLLIPQLSSLESRLSNPDFHGIPQLTINYDLIEVQPAGWFFSIKERHFIQSALDDDDLGKVTPRAFIGYTFYPGRQPKPPESFITGLSDAFPDDTLRRRFLVKLYQLLMKDAFPFKAKKLCVVGPPNCGKTSWFSVIQGIISHEHVASITKEGKFATHLINKDTEVVVIEEWEKDTLPVQDCKKLLQGEVLYISQKGKSATKVNYNSGIYLTCNDLPVYTGRDGRAIYDRLEVFHAQPIKKVRADCKRKFRHNCMQIIHWMTTVIGDAPLFSGVESTSSQEEDDEELGAKYNSIDGETLFDVAHVIGDARVHDRKVDMKICDESVLPETTVQRVTVAVEEEMMKKMKPNSACIYQGDINTPAYHTSVYMFALGLHGELEDVCSEACRTVFNRRIAFGWTGADSLYDAYRLSLWNPRVEFDYPQFCLTYPNWDDLAKPRYPESYVPVQEIVKRQYSMPQLPISHTQQNVEEDESSDSDVPVRRLRRKRAAVVMSSSDEGEEDACPNNRSPHPRNYRKRLLEGLESTHAHFFAEPIDVADLPCDEGVDFVVDNTDEGAVRDCINNIIDIVVKLVET